MSVEIVVPDLGESITEATVAKWFKSEGDPVEVDEPLLELETDKVAVEVNAQAAGVLSEIVAAAGAEVEVGAVLGRIAGGAAEAQPRPAAKAPRPEAAKAETHEPQAPAAEAAPPPEAAAPPAAKPAPEAPPEAPPAAREAPPEAAPAGPSATALSPAVRKLVE
ncbi:MAG: biotin/lipoyl-containing protein, partial [Alphaproteobacteria bacterium]